MVSPGLHAGSAWSGSSTTAASTMGWMSVPNEPCRAGGPPEGGLRPEELRSPEVSLKKARASFGHSRAGCVVLVRM